ncbi:MAG: IS66 family transposase [Thaumarchaeota archaeon]|nr:IS66 family transposase [Nitrososphaerota archaeon]
MNKPSKPYKKLYREARTENIRLRQTMEIQESGIQEQEYRIQEQESQMQAPERRLEYYDNANTPPSHNALSRQGRRQKKMQEKGGAGKAGKPRGAPGGHRGATSRPKPTEFKEHTPDRCPRCGSARLRVTDTEYRDITEVPPPPEAVTTRHEINTCACRACGEEEILPDTGLPSAGNYGHNVIAQVVSDRAERMPFRRNASAVRGLEMSSTTPHNIMRRVGVCLGRPTGEIAASMRRAAVVHADETSIRLNGVKVWVWIFFDPATGNTLFVVRPGRGADVPREVLGEGWDGTLVCDGWTSYKRYRVQRCRAHITREMRHAAEKCGCRKCNGALETLRRTYADACNIASSRMSGARRAAARRRLHKRIRAMMRRCGSLHAIGKFMGKLGRALPDLFRFVLDPSIPPTNNAAERGLREIVVHRKMRGGIRAEGTMEWMGNLFTCVSTWKNRGLDYLQEIARYV